LAKSNRLTPVAIERTSAKTADVWLSDDDGTRGGGRLVVRISKRTRLFYFRYSIDGTRKQMPMRPWAKEPADGRLTLEQARQLARTYSDLHREPATRDVEAYFQRLRDQAEAARCCRCR
jgi:hypothetical protein